MLMGKWWKLQIRSLKDKQFWFFDRYIDLKSVKFPYYFT